jgi:hypothetical protein
MIPTEKMIEEHFRNAEVLICLSDELEYNIGLRVICFSDNAWWIDEIEVWNESLGYALIKKVIKHTKIKLIQADHSGTYDGEEFEDRVNSFCEGKIVSNIQFFYSPAISSRHVAYITYTL